MASQDFEELRMLGIIPPNLMMRWLSRPKKAVQLRACCGRANWIALCVGAFFYSMARYESPSSVRVPWRGGEFTFGEHASVPPRHGMTAEMVEGFWHALADDAAEGSSRRPDGSAAVKGIADAMHVIAEELEAHRDRQREIHRRSENHSDDYRVGLANGYGIAARMIHDRLAELGFVPSGRITSFDWSPETKSVRATEYREDEP